jgi:hypothetical protein
MEEDYSAAYKEVVEITAQQEAEKVKKEKASIDKSFKTANEKLDKTYKSGKDEWINQLVERTLTD